MCSPEMAGITPRQILPFTLKEAVMDRNDEKYFVRLTPEVLESRFDGYDVPENVKTRAKNIMRRFTINGLCDGMYIANCIGMDNGTGDGKGHFTEGEITEVKKIAAFLMHAYGCNIFNGDEGDLLDILRDGSLPDDRMVDGLKKSIEIRKTRIGQTTDNFRREFMYGEIGIIVDTINRIKAAQN